MRRRSALILTAAFSWTGCALAEAPSPSPTEIPVAEARADSSAGSLRLDDLSVSLVTENRLRIRFTPLDPDVGRLAAPDTRAYLGGLARLPTAGEAAASDPTTLVLVTFESHTADQRFDPDQVEIESAGRRLEPRSVTAVTDGWHAGRTRPHAPQAAIYGFERFDVLRPFRVRYGGEWSDAWRDRLPLLDLERSRLGRGER